MTAKDLLVEYRKIINPPYQLNNLVILVLSVFVLISIPLTAFAAMQDRRQVTKAAAGTATMSLSPASKTLNQGESFTVQIREDSGTEPVNAVQANLTYDANMLDFVSIDDTGTAFGFPLDESGGGGSVKIARMSIPDSQTGDQLIATVTFTAKTIPGATTIDFASGTAIVRSTDNVDILGSTTPGTYTIGDPPPSVTITNPTSGETVSGTINVIATATDNIGVNKVDFSIDGKLRSSDSTSPYEYSWDTTTETDVDHTITATAFDTNNNSAKDSVTVTVNNVDTQPPSTPTNLSANAVAYNRVDLSWIASSDNKVVTGYWIVRDGVAIASSTTNSFSDATVLPSTTYSYQVIAFDAVGNNSALSNTATTTTPQAPDTEAPTAPTNLVAGVASSSQINLSWNASTDNIGVSGYNIYRNGSANPIATVTTTTFGDAGLAASTSYSYTVKAKDSAENISGSSNTASATTLPPPSDGTLSGAVRNVTDNTALAGVTIKVSTFGIKGKKGLVTTATTNSSGVYAVTLKQGSYTVVASLKRYSKQTKNTTVSSGDTKTLNFSLTRKGKGNK